MVPIEKVRDIITKYENLEKELSSGKIDPKLFAKKSKEYSSLGEIIITAKKFVNFENERNDLINIVQDKSNDQEMVDLAQKDLNELMKKKEKYENDLKVFLYGQIQISTLQNLKFLNITNTEHVLSTREQV